MNKHTKIKNRNANRVTFDILGLGPGDGFIRAPRCEHCGGAAKYILKNRDELIEYCFNLASSIAQSMIVAFPIQGDPVMTFNVEDNVGGVEIDRKQGDAQCMAYIRDVWAGLRNEMVIGVLQETSHNNWEFVEA